LTKADQRVLAGVDAEIALVTLRCDAIDADATIGYAMGLARAASGQRGAIQTWRFGSHVKSSLVAHGLEFAVRPTRRGLTPLVIVFVAHRKKLSELHEYLESRPRTKV
jgi:hypothetical protein